ncbi:hypothetical protein M5W83_20845 [Paenibacillus thiaminolyticus]|uniref:Uncharacterized protein n=1 Tax=Paenibacillus thiaminolyticus TaxID=49283 RepID=A0ABT4G0K0_PANTH|nr:hypothetical protein [Paenibacillus thiaminolyticus]MCY9534921.1 hypothetical protein [Paenibacillus thiaminolyticus]MCY9604301.1 hypothetical protein [Paenibacillus thiaminolyticus]MCY9609601.1 hypothetical protein [Paenibacillus thiaminolyticus]MCY9612449.1 hypothetical protein [Paenibacillus thiaminolyticus]MCY9617430.1 hypothetical protein [Paenibacillus thiaminolyticus]
MYNNVPGHGCAACGHHPARRDSGFIGIGRRWQALGEGLSAAAMEALRRQTGYR